MPAYNIFKVYRSQSSNLKELLVDKGLTFVETKRKVENHKTFIYELYFSTSPEERNINWIQNLQTLFSIDNYTIKNYSAVILLSFDDCLYAVSFGSAHFYVSRFSDSDFGIEIASRLISTFIIKNSKEFVGQKTRSIETYHPLKEIPFEAGEAVFYLKGRTIDGSTWGKNISCGQSVQIRKKDVKIKNIHKICLALENALLLPKSIVIPRSTHVEDVDQVNSLTQNLIIDIQNGNYLINISQLQLSGIEFRFVDRYNYFIRINRNEYEIDENITREELADFVNLKLGADYHKLLNTIVVAKEDGVSSFRKNFIQFIEYVDTQNNYYLDDGRWYKFDQIYLDNIKNEVDLIPLLFSQEIVVFNETEYQTWRNNQTDGLTYREYYLNNFLFQNYEYKNRDRALVLFEDVSIEESDLYKENTLFIVKIGVPQKLNYAIDQATASINYLRRNNFNINVNNEQVQIKKMCLWFFIERQSEINSLTEIKSLIFLMKIADWRKTVLMSGLQPEVKISYKH